jgi:hypothetical protein
MYNSRVKNLELPENLFSNLGELKSRKIENKPLPPINNTTPILNDFKIDTNVKLTNYSDRKEYRDRIDRMYEDIKGIVPIDNEIDNILYFNNYVEKGIVVKPKITSLKQFWTEYRLINNEKIEKKHQEEPIVHLSHIMVAYLQGGCRMPPSMITTVPMTEIGTIFVRVSTAGIALPVEGADIRIQGAEEGNRSIVFLLTTDRSGLGEAISVPTPPASVSQTPGNIKGFADYDIEVFKSGFYPVILRHVPVFSGVTSVQPVELIPWPSYRKDDYPPTEEIDFTESEPLFREERE